MSKRLLSVEMTDKSEDAKPLAEPLARAAVATATSAPDADVADDAGAKASRGRAALQRATRKIVLAQRVAKPISSKGVPLLPASTFAHALPSSSAVSDTPTNAMYDLAAQFISVRCGAWQRGWGVSPHARVRASASASAHATHPLDPQHHSTLPNGTPLLADALANRSPNMRLASSVGVSLESAKKQAGHTSEQASFARRHNMSMERLLSSKVYRYFMQLVVVGHCLLACWESIPPSQIAPPFTWATGVAELFCLCLYTFDQIATVTTYGPRHYLDKRWEITFLLITLVTWIDWFLYYAAGMHGIFRFARMFRPLLGVSKKKSLRRLLASILRTIPKMLDISLLLFVVVMFYGTVGLQLFNREQVPGYSPFDDNFDSWPAAALAMFVLTTTENYPNVANEAYRHRPVVATLFFVTALFIMLWLVLPLILAIVYDHYKDVHKNMVRAKRVKQYLSLIFAYQTIMGGDGNKEMTLPVFTSLVRRVKKLKYEEMVHMFEALDVDGSGAITVAEFLRLPTVLRVQVAFHEEPEEVVGTAAPMSARCYQSLRIMARTIIRTRWFWWLCMAVILLSCAVGSVWTVQYQREYDECMCIPYSQPPVDDNTNDDGGEPVAHTTSTLTGLYSVSYLMNEAASLLGLGSTATADDGTAFQDLPGCVVGPDCGSSPIRWSNYVGLACSLFQALELAIRTLAHEPELGASKWRRVWAFARTWNMVDTLIVVWSCMSYVALIAGVHEKSPLPVADIFEVGRALAFIRILSLFARMREIFDTLGQIIGLVMQFTAVYTTISYGFAIVGMAILGGISQTDGQALCQNCQLWTFDSFPKAWLSLLQLTVGNNWNSILYPNMQYLGTRWAAWYFMAYRFFMTDIMMNIIEGVMIEAYTRSEEERERVREVAKLAAEASASPSVSSGSGNYKPPSADGNASLPRKTSHKALVAIQYQRPLFEDISAEDDEPNGPIAPTSALLQRRNGGARSGGSTVPPAGSLNADGSEAGGGSGGSGRSLNAALSAAASRHASASPPSIYGISSEELEMLEVAVRAQDARISRRAAAAVASAAMPPVNVEPSAAASATVPLLRSVSEEDDVEATS